MDESADELKNGVFTGYFRENDSYTIARPAGREDWLLVYTLEGQGYFRTPAGEKISKAGELILLRKRIPHTYGTVKGETWNFMWVHFNRLPELSLLPDEEILHCPLPSSELQRRVLRTFRSLLHDSRGQGGFWQELCDNQLSALILLMAGQLADKLDYRVSQVIRILSAQMQEPLSINELAARVGLSASRLSHLFKAETGRSIVDTLNHMRLEQAALLMLKAGRTAGEAAFDVGFQSYNHFAALFRRRYGCGPAEYKRKTDFTPSP
ncbi:AraC family transcriptional regulator, arabinose operon regulatory protein [Paenibacillus catalpae]|uniref:AraC family transcriptional regulator, arabinose operon regulatory protein n=1 Tax=Paenibacillus catalpae TaxID=1045775 RepID=A0A1I1XCE9_9BACL|nr:AraC family transcriptional regulator [Paenibacillus catalpae]SFE05012.1 AraC family transcriptional regulator, arabinose operon regulatory protein [Paenibacillus catalpae]